MALEKAEALVNRFSFAEEYKIYRKPSRENDISIP